MLKSKLCTVFKFANPSFHESENLRSYSIKFSNLARIALPLLSEIEESLLSISQDRKVLIISSTLQDSKELNIDTDSNWINTLQEYLDDQYEDEIFELEFQIRKKLSLPPYNIYSQEHFFSYLTNLDTKGSFYVFEELVSNDLLDIKLHNSELTFATRSFSFNTKTSNHKLDRLKKIQQIDSVCHRRTDNQIRLLPEDFCIDSSLDDQQILNYFSQLELILTISSIWDITKIDFENDNLECRLNGYKSINQSISLRNISTNSLSEYRRIYEWIYTGGNLSDKMGLARNIISLHLNKQNSFDLTGHVFDSIKSGFEIYLKTNITQYIEIRNKINDQLTEITKSSNEIVDKFTSDFQKSILSFVSFFVSVVVLRFVSKSDFDNIMGYDLTIISFGFVAISAIYLVYSLHELKSKKKRFEKNYHILKNRFSDVLTKEDINRILNHDEQFLSDSTFINHSKRRYLWAWVAVIFVFIVLILFTSQLFDLKNQIINLFFYN